MAQIAAGKGLIHYTPAEFREQFRDSNELTILNHSPDVHPAGLVLEKVNHRLLTECRKIIYDKGLNDDQRQTKLLQIAKQVFDSFLLPIAKHSVKINVSGDSCQIKSRPNKAQFQLTSLSAKITIQVAKDKIISTCPAVLDALAKCPNNQLVLDPKQAIYLRDVNPLPVVDKFQDQEVCQVFCKTLLISSDTPLIIEKGLIEPEYQLVIVFVSVTGITITRNPGKKGKQEVWEGKA